MLLIAILCRIHTWHHALIAIALAIVLTPLCVIIILAKRITFISLPKKEFRFEKKR